MLCFLDTFFFILIVFVFSQCVVSFFFFAVTLFCLMNVCAPNRTQILPLCCSLLCCLLWP
jgi:hypothetical protein